MQLLAALSYTALFFSVTSLAAPSVLPSSTSRIEVTVDEEPLLSGPEALRRAYLKYGATPPSSIVARATVSGTVTATPETGDVDYLIPVAVGSPPTTYSMNLNTGGSDFDLYAPKLGTSGSITTKVSIGGVTVNNQVVNLEGSSSTSNNLVGMSYSGKTFYTNAVSQATIAAVFTANLNKGAPGTYGLGFINATAYKGSITYTTVSTANGFWEFTGSGYAVGTGAFVSSNIDGIVDTGTTLLLLPQAVVTAYYNQVSGSKYDNTQGGYTFPCRSALPDLILGIGSYRATVPGSYINYAPTDSSGTTCFGGLQSSDGLGFSIFGLVFIKSQFVVFKGTTSPTLGFAKKA